MYLRLFVACGLWMVCSVQVTGQINRNAPRFTPVIDGVITDEEMAGQLEVSMAWPVPGGSLLLQGAGYDPAQLSAIWYVSWDMDNLNISAVVLDDTPDFRLSSGGAGNVPYNAQDLIQPVFNPFNDPDFLFVDGQAADADHGENIAAIYDMVVNTSDDFGPDIYRHGPALSAAEHDSIEIEGEEFDFGYVLEATIPWATAMDDADPGYIPTINDVHGLGFILVNFNGEAGATADIAALYTDFGNGVNTIGTPASWNSVTLVEALVQPVACDLNNDGSCDLVDLDELQYVGLGGSDSKYDFDGSGGTIDSDDTAAWLATIDTVAGDADLDGDVDANDLNAVGINWQSTTITSWAGGDFDGNSIVDAGDLNVLGINWQHGAAAASNAAVPEPSSGWLLGLGLLSLYRSRRSCHRFRRQPRILEALEPRYVLDSTVVFNELMYHPRAEDGAEWIELHNQQGVDIDISGWRLTDGIQFKFPQGTIVPRSGYLVVAADVNDVSVEGDAMTLGPFTGSLANGGELIRLLNNNDRIMDELDFRDQFPWPVGPDGSGATLAKRNPNAGSSDPNNWTTSARVAGTPGVRNFPSNVVEFFALDFHSLGDEASIHVPTSNALGNTWTTTSFVEGAAGESWSQQPTGVGYFVGELGEPYPDSVLADNPLAYWRFTETDAANPAVNSGTLGASAIGSFNPEAQVGADSVIGDALDRSLMVSPGNSDIQFESLGFEKVGAQGRTTEFWVAIEDEPTRESPLVSDGEGALDFGLAITLSEERRIRVRMKTDISFIGFSSYDGDRVLNVGDVVHVVANWSATTGDSQLFLDGVEVAHINPSGPVPNSGNAVSTNNRVFVGRDGRTSINPSARIDEVAIYNYLLGSNRVAAHFEAGAPTFSGLFQSEIAGMHDVGTSAYLRKPFELSANAAVDQLTMEIQYDDAFVAYLNGVEVARRNVTGNVGFGSVSLVDRTFDDARQKEVIDLSSRIELLQPGTNVLAIHGMNASIDDEDFLLSPRLFALASEIPDALGPDVVLNEVSAASATMFQIELKNNGKEPADLDGFIVALDGDAPAEFTLANVTLQPGEIRSLNASDLGFRGRDGDHLFIYNDDRSIVLDAQAVTNRLRGRSELHDGQWLYPAAETPGAENSFAFNGDVVINEIMYHAPIVRGTPDVEPTEQWIELYNRGSQTVDLTGWKFVDGISFDFRPGTTIGSHQYLIVSNNAVALATKYPSLSNVVGDFGGRISHAGDRIELSDAWGNPADTVDFRDQGRWDEWADGGGSSLELRDADADNAQPESWQASDETAGGTWQTITYRGPVTGTFGPTQYHEFILGLLDAGEVLLDDISVIEDPDGDARQLIQNGTFEADTLGGPAAKWRIIGTHEQSQVVVDPDNLTNQVLHMIATGPTEHMHNHAETSLKFGDQFVNINNSKQYEISFRARWLAGSDLLNSRLYFNRLPKTTALMMPQDWGTPGQQNSRFVDNIGPTYTDFQHVPVVPVPDQMVTVTVAAADPNGIAEMKLHYMVDGGAMTSTPMFINGDGMYAASIPGWEAGTIVQFYVEGRDNLGAAATFPAAGADSRALYVVSDGKASELGVHNFRIVMLTEDANRLHEETNVMSNARQSATVIYDESEVYYDVGVRLKGSERGRNTSVRVGFNVQFDPLDLFRGVHQSVGIDRSGSGDEFQQKEILVKQTMNHAGGVTDLQDDIIHVITPRAAHTGSALLQMARYNDLFLDTQFANGSDGALFKYELVYYPTTTVGNDREGLKRPNPDQVVGVNVRLQGTKENHRWTFLNRNNPERDDYRQLMNALTVMGLSGNEFYEKSREVLDVDQWLRSFAVQTLWGVADNYTSGAQHNGYFYFRPSDGRMLFLPWDVDFSGSAGATSSLVQNNDLAKLVALPENKHYYYGHMHDIVSTSYNNDYMDYWIDHYQSFLTNQSLQNFKNYIRTRSQFALNTITTEVPDVDFAITTNGGSNFNANQVQVTLEGNGWIDVREIRVTGSATPLNVNWPTASQWNVKLPLLAGQNTFVLEAYNLQGQLVGSDSIVVTSTVANPVVDSLRIAEINYHPSDPTLAELAINPQLVADDFEFIEFVNIGSSAINPAGTSFTNGIRFTFPSIEIGAGQRVAVASDTAAFQARYGGGITPISEIDSGQLSNAGEKLTLVDGLGQVILDFSYSDSDPWPDLADGSGATLEVVNVQSTPASEYGDSWRWRASTATGGSPGSAGANPIGVVINEVLAHTDPPVVPSDSIELRNTTNAAVNIGGWYLSDANSNLLKFQIPAGTILGPGGYIVFDEDDFNPSMGANPTQNPRDFALSGASGDDIYLVIANGNRVTTFVDDVHFGASRNGESFGRVADYSDGLAPLVAVSLGSANSAPRVGPVLVSEVNFNPGTPSAAALAADPTITTNDLEFLEIHNPTTQQVDLTNWRIRRGVDYDFANGLQLPAGGTFVIVSFNAESPANQNRLSAFRAHYGIDSSVTILGGYTGQLNDSGESVVLQRPDSPPLDDPNLIPRLTEDEIRYDNAAPWPVTAAGGGDSLQRASTSDYGNLTNSWVAATPSPGVFDVERKGDFTADGVVNADDIDALFAAIRDGNPAPEFDLNSSGATDQADVTFLVENILKTYLGDANLDGKVDAIDLNRVGIRWQQNNVSGWASGDFNGDRRIDAADLNAVGLNWQRGTAVGAAATARTRQPRAPLAFEVRPFTFSVKAKEINNREIDNADTSREVSRSRFDETTSHHRRPVPSRSRIQRIASKTPETTSEVQQNLVDHVFEFALFSQNGLH